MLKVRKSRDFVPERIENILVRGTNWIGDVIMSLPAVSSVRRAFPQARIAVLAKPWVAEIYRICPDVDDVIVFQSPGIHDGIGGKIRLAKQLKKEKFDLAILLQNAIEAALIVWLARIPLRAGYNSDCRGFLLTHSVRRTQEVRTIHQIGYYIEMARSLGLGSSERVIHIAPDGDYSLPAKKILAGHDIKEKEILIGMAPGASYGPAKMWFPERFAAVADRLADEFSARIILFGSPGDRERTDLIQQYSKNPIINLAGETTLNEVIGLIRKCDLFISNDSGLMHLAGALDIPLIAIFGSTNPATTSPVGERSIVIHKDVPCSPCLKKTCPTDFRCMDLIGVDDVCDAARMLLKNGHGSNVMSGER
ncbi:MAG TPA: lipopolysaccharide heptosyltransferase II [Syntrophales bacterium]|nr:lipopolysaccharide heptosyltransferase II [Syntrophales bacterium]HPQ43057.1 lipopolysaccharide heptosyltransferase II [Syntrophales bacterium]